MEIPKELRYSREHEWVAVEGNVATIGITDYAQEQLGDVVYVELPEIGAQVKKDEPFGVVESVKAVSDIFAPVSGAVSAANRPLADNPEKVNADPYGEAWIIRVEMSTPSELAELMTAAEYERFVEEEQKDH
jgi:glycine cleavage system H protein